MEQPVQFSINDRVLASKVHDKPSIEGKLGTIIDIHWHGKFPSILVEFDEYFDGGHNGNHFTSIQGEPGHCWWIMLAGINRLEHVSLVAVGQNDLESIREALYDLCKFPIPRSAEYDMTRLQVCSLKAKFKEISGKEWPSCW